MRTRRGVSLAELMITAAVVAIILGCIIFVGLNRQPDVDKEAEKVANWLMEHMTRAQVEESSFRLNMSLRAAEQGNLQITLIWLSGRSAGTRENYHSTEAFMRDTGNIFSRTYDGLWQTLTPALTLAVEPEAKSSGKPVYVKVSGNGNVKITNSRRD